MDDIYDVDNMSDEEAESKAHTLGWRPKEEFSGDPEKYTDAKTFLRKANDNIPMLRENYRKVEAQNQKFQEQLETLSKEVSIFNQRLEDAERRGYEKAVRDIELQQRQAAMTGDLDKYDELQKKKDELAEKSDVTYTTAPQTKGTGGMSMNDEIALQVFQMQNPWFRTDRDLNEDMSAYVLGIKARNPNMDMAEVLERAKNKVVRANPEKFAESKKANDVLSGNGSTSAKLSYSGLPEKAIYDSEWAYMEREMRIKGKPEAEIEKFKKSYQANCLSNK